MRRAAIETGAASVDILFLLIPLSAGLVLGIVGVFGWALHRGQFDDLDREGRRFVDLDESASLDVDQGRNACWSEQSPAVHQEDAAAAGGPP
jgi:cbb3-type cytochrome oxidase maturation protein